MAISQQNLTQPAVNPSPPNECDSAFWFRTARPYTLTYRNSFPAARHSFVQFPMKKFIFVLFLTLGSIRLLAGGWGAAPPFTAVQGSAISGVTAWGTSVAPYGSPMPGFLVAWYKDPTGAWHGMAVIGTGTYTQRIPSSGYLGMPSFTVSSEGTYTLAIYSSTSSSTSASPTGTLEVQQNITVTPLIQPTTFTFSNLYFTYDGGLKTATVSPTPANATYTADLTKGPASGTYTVTATANGNFSGSGSDTLTIAAPPNTAPTVSWVNNPTTAYVNQWFNVQARGDDQDGNISYVYVWRDGQPFAFNGFPNGFTQYSDNNGAMSSVPGTITFTAKCGDSAGADSGFITHTVTIINRPPQITMSASRTTIEFGESLNLTSVATDADSNLAFHGILVLNETDSDWYRSASTDHSNGSRRVIN